MEKLDQCKFLHLDPVLDSSILSPVIIVLLGKSSAKFYPRRSTMTPKLKLVFLLTSILMVAAQASASYQECTSTITGNFNGTAINQGDYIWFTGVLTVKGLGSTSTTVYVSHASVTFTVNNQTYTIKVPSSAITFSSATTVATTDYVQLQPLFLGKGWKTQLQLTGLAGNDLMTAVEFKVPAGGLPGGIKDVALTATFSSYAAGLTVNCNGARPSIPPLTPITTPWA